MLGAPSPRLPFSASLGALGVLRRRGGYVCSLGPAFTTRRVWASLLFGPSRRGSLVPIPLAPSPREKPAQTVSQQFPRAKFIA